MTRRSGAGPARAGNGRGAVRVRLLPWAILWGWAIWSELPTPTLLVGIVLVVGSGLYVFRREAIRAREGAR